MRITAIALMRVPVLVMLAIITAIAFISASFSARSARPRVLRWFFDRAGGGVVKVGQLLATRFDLLPAAYCEELGTLLDDLRPVSANRIRERIVHSLGQPIDELFATFDDQPISTASLAQVHGATLPDGHRVVIKVLKPGVSQLVAVDMFFLQIAANTMAYIPILNRLDVIAAAKQLRRQATEELNLEREAADLAFFSKAMAADAVPHSAPRPFRHLCSSDVLTMERVSGVSVREILSALHHGDDERLAAWARQGITPQGLSRLVFRSVIEQSMRFRMFNADPHPSNLIVGQNGQLQWVDFGIVGWLDEKQWSTQLRLRHAVLHGQIHRAYRLFIESAGPFDGYDLRNFESDMKDAIRAYIVAARDLDAPIAQRSTGAFLISTLTILRRYRLPLRPDVIPLYRTILIADIVMLRLDPRVDWLAEMDSFLKGFIADQAEEAVRAPVTDPAILSALINAPSTLLAGLDWLDRRMLTGPEAAPARPSATDQLVSGFVRILTFAGLAALLLVVALLVGLVPGPTMGWPAGAAQWIVNHPVIALVLAIGANVALARWSRRFRQ